MIQRRNFNCPETGAPCINGNCLRDKCIDRAAEESRQMLDELEQEKIRQLYRDLCIDVPPGRLKWPTVS